MKKVTVEVYELLELSEEAQEKAYQDWYKDALYPWYDENRATLEGFQKLFNNIDVDWSYDSCSGYATIQGDFKYEYSYEIESLQGIRLFKYLYNNFSETILKESDEISLTGFYLDDIILQPIRDFMKRPADIRFYDLINMCLYAWAKQCSNDLCEYFSVENFEEESSNNDWHYLEDGSFFELQK